MGQLDDTQDGRSARTEAMRWTVYQAAMEFDIAKETLSKEFRKCGILPGPDGKYSTMDVCRAKFGDLERERIRKVKAEADGVEMENARKRGELVARENVVKFCVDVASAVVQRIKASPLPHEVIDDTLEEISIMFQEHEITRRTFT